MTTGIDSVFTFEDWNLYDFSPQDIKKLINKPYTIPGISDGGAHMSSIPAQYAGLHDRGVIRIDSPADIIVYDLEELGWTEAEKAYDLPAGDWRRVTKGLGYRYTLVNGDVTFIDGESTGATPGHLLRNGHA